MTRRLLSRDDVYAVFYTLGILLVCPKLFHFIAVHMLEWGCIALDLRCKPAGY